MVTLNVFCTRTGEKHIGPEWDTNRFIYLYTDTHQYLSPNSCHPKHVTNNIPTTVVTKCRMNCSDRIENDKLFKGTLIHYKAYLIKSGYKEADINKTFINFAIKRKRKSILKRKIRKNSLFRNTDLSPISSPHSLILLKDLEIQTYTRRWRGINGSIPTCS